MPLTEALRPQNSFEFWGLFLLGKRRTTGNPGGRKERKRLGKEKLMLFATALNTADNSWQLTAATLVGLMSVPGLVVLYGGVMQRRWSVNSMMLTFVALALVLVVWVLYGYDMGFGNPWHGIAKSGFFGTFIGQPGAVLNHIEEQGAGDIPL